MRGPALGLPAKRRHSGLASALTVVAAGVALTGCATVKAGLGPKDQVCFSSIPAAKAVVGPKAQFAGVRFVSPHDLLEAVRGPNLQDLGPPDALQDFGRHGACLVGYRGALGTKVIAHAWRPVPGPVRFLVVVVRQSDHHVLGVIALPKTYLRFTHLF
jgi:hypothetical protein